MLVRLLAKLFINPINIPLRCFGRLLAKLFINPINISPAALRLRCAPQSPFEGGILDVAA